MPRRKPGIANASDTRIITYKSRVNQTEAIPPARTGKLIESSQLEGAPYQDVEKVRPWLCSAISRKAVPLIALAGCFFNTLLCLLFLAGHYMKTHHLSICLLGVMALTETAYAEETNFGKKTPSADQVIEALSAAARNPAGDKGKKKPVGKSRSIDMSGLNASPDNTKVLQQADEVALSIEILFPYDSAELTAAAKEHLKPVGEALASEKLQNLAFVVEGHTDAIGGDEYNKSLSEKRAASVKQFLADTFHINPSRMQIRGKGKSDLLDPGNPGSEANRRVRIVAIK